MIPNLDFEAKLAIKTYAADRIKKLHLALEADNQLSETQIIRGKIKELRALEVEVSDPKTEVLANAAVSY